MKIVCLIQPLPPTIYFVNTIHRHHPVSSVLIEVPSQETRIKQVRQQVGHTLQAYGLFETLLAAWESVFHPLQSRYRHIHTHYFQDAWQTLDSGIPTLAVECINSPRVLERLEQEQPDLILDHGTSIVADRILSTAPLALNVHWGLSPYYRGTHCTEWALLNWDPYNIGVTIHRLARKIDGGDILAQQRATIASDDTVYSINMQLTRMATHLLLKIIKHLQADKPLRFKKQILSQGFITLDRQWSRYCRKQVQFIERNHIIQQMLERPARRNRLPIVDFEC